MNAWMHLPNWACACATRASAAQWWLQTPKGAWHEHLSSQTIKRAGPFLIRLLTSLLFDDNYRYWEIVALLGSVSPDMAAKQTVQALASVMTLTLMGLWLWLPLLWSVGGRQTLAMRAYLLEACVLARGCNVCAGCLAPRLTPRLILYWHGWRCSGDWDWLLLRTCTKAHQRSSARPVKAETRDIRVIAAAVLVLAEASRD